MVNEAKIIDKKINITNGVFKIDSLYKGIKEKAESLGYLFVERRQEKKPTKYGEELEAHFYLDKEYDYFGKVETVIELNFENLKKVKGHDLGDLKGKIVATQKLDYKNRWGKNKFNKFLFNVYLKIKKEDFKQKYTILIITETNEIYDFIKGELEEY